MRATRILLANPSFFHQIPSAVLTMGAPVDEDTVLATKYAKSIKKPALPPKGLPEGWRPLRIDVDRPFGEAQFPEGVTRDSLAIDLFQLFVTDELLDRIAYHTNQHAEKLRAAP